MPKQKIVQEIIKKSLTEVLKRHKNGAIIMMEIPTDNYFEASSRLVKLLTKRYCLFNENATSLLTGSILVNMIPLKQERSSQKHTMMLILFRN